MRNMFLVEDNENSKLYHFGTLVPIKNEYYLIFNMLHLNFLPFNEKIIFKTYKF